MNRRIAVFALGMIFMMSFAASVSAAETALEDEFTVMDAAKWTTVSTSGGGVTIDAGVMELGSGAGPAGGGTSLLSTAVFDLSIEAIAVEARCRIQTDPFQEHDAAMFGFINGSNYVAFYLREAGIGGADRTLYGEVRSGFDYAGIMRPDANDVGEFHVYRIEVGGGTAIFLIDGVEVGTTACLSIESQPFRVVFNHLCPGAERSLWVDWVRVETGVVPAQRATWGGVKSRFQ